MGDNSCWCGVGVGLLFLLLVLFATKVLTTILYYTISTLFLVWIKTTWRGGKKMEEAVVGDEETKDFLR